MVLGERAEDVGVHAERHDGDLAGGHAHLPHDVLPRGRGHGDDRQPARDPGLHAGERVPAPQRQPPGAGRMRQLQLAVDVDRVVDRGQDRQALAPDAEDAVREALVVVDHVELGPPAAQLAPGAEAERQGLGEAADAHRAQLQQVHGRAGRAGGAERRLRPVQVEAVEAGQAKHADVVHRHYSTGGEPSLR